MIEIKTKMKLENKKSKTRKESKKNFNKNSKIPDRNGTGIAAIGKANSIPKTNTDTRNRYCEPDRLNLVEMARVVFVFVKLPTRFSF